MTRFFSSSSSPSSSFFLFLLFVYFLGSTFFVVVSTIPCEINTSGCLTTSNVNPLPNVGSMKRVTIPVDGKFAYMCAEGVGNNTQQILFAYSISYVPASPPYTSATLSFLEGYLNPDGLCTHIDLSKGPSADSFLYLANGLRVQIFSRDSSSGLLTLVSTWSNSSGISRFDLNSGGDELWGVSSTSSKFLRCDLSTSNGLITACTEAFAGGTSARPLVPVFLSASSIRIINGFAFVSYSSSLEVAVFQRTPTAGTRVSSTPTCQVAEMLDVVDSGGDCLYLSCRSTANIQFLLFDSSSKNLGTPIDYLLPAGYTLPAGLTRTNTPFVNIFVTGVGPSGTNGLVTYRRSTVDGSLTLDSSNFGVPGGGLETALSGAGDFLFGTYSATSPVCADVWYLPCASTPSVSLSTSTSATISLSASLTKSQTPTSSISATPTTSPTSSVSTSLFLSSTHSSSTSATPTISFSRTPTSSSSTSLTVSRTRTSSNSLTVSRTRTSSKSPTTSLTLSLTSSPSKSFSSFPSLTSSTSPLPSGSPFTSSTQLLIPPATSISRSRSRSRAPSSSSSKSINLLQGVTCESGIACSDNDPCTLDYCIEGMTCIHQPVVCNDQDACTRDSCSNIDGLCVFEPLNQNCDTSCSSIVDCQECGATSSSSCAWISCRDSETQDQFRNMTVISVTEDVNTTLFDIYYGDSSIFSQLDQPNETTQLGNINSTSFLLVSFRLGNLTAMLVTQGQIQTLLQLSVTGYCVPGDLIDLELSTIERKGSESGNGNMECFENTKCMDVVDNVLGKEAVTIGVAFGGSAAAGGGFVGGMFVVVLVYYRRSKKNLNWQSQSQDNLEQSSLYRQKSEVNPLFVQG